MLTWIVDKTSQKEGGHLVRRGAESVKVQSSAQSEPAPPCWFGEMVLIVTDLHKLDLLEKIPEQVRFARQRFGQL